MNTNYKFNRQFTDFLLTDLLPYEKGNHYTHIFFYNFLQKNKEKLSSLIKNMKSHNTYFDPTWHNAPLKFKISKKEENFREISLINPLGLLESLIFINLFENDIINILHNKIDFSCRKAYRTNSLTYKKDKNQTVYYSGDPDSKKQLQISLESSGSYFKHYPFKSITNLLNSKRYLFARDKFDLLLKLDIQDCFPSIYTHSFKWLISNKVYDSKNLRNSNSVYKNIDTFLQNINGSKTNGIIVGPEVSRLLAEFLFTHLDQKVIENLREANLFEGRDYIVYRFVDDYYICTNIEANQSLIKDEIVSILNEFQLKINNMKLTKMKKNEINSSWLIEVSPVIQDIEKIFKSEQSNFVSNITDLLNSLEIKEELTETLIQAAAGIETINDKRIQKSPFTKAIKKIKYIDLRNKVLKIINETNESSLICSYILSAVLKKVENGQNKIFNINMELNEFIVFILFLYSKDVSYSSSQKLIRILSLLVEKAPEDFPSLIEKNLERFDNDIFKGYTNDWIDLLLFFSSNRINLSNDNILKITEKIIKEENPLQVAALCLFYETSLINSTPYVKSVNQIIKEKVEKINWDDFFQDELSWWVFIFISYPRINKNIKKEIVINLKRLQGQLSEDIGDQAKRVILEFLIENDYHFIEWNFTKENYYKKFYFYTKDRTVFNPDIISQFSISR
ncbi:RNA-directed DNA polymerase [Bacillus sp. AK031]